MTLAESYVYCIYRCKSFSLAAKELFISQPALSATVARLEKELGFRIFDRSTAPLTLTPEGSIYMDTLHEIEEARRIMKKRIQSLGETTAHDVLIGATTFVGHTLLPFIAGEHTKRFPSSRFSIDMSIYIEPMLEKLLSHTIDLVASYDTSDKRFVNYPLFEEQRVVAIPRHLVTDKSLLPHALTRERVLRRDYTDADMIDDIYLFSHVPFLPQRSDTAQAAFTSELMQSAAVSHHSIPNIPSLTSNYYMACAGLGACVTTETIVAGMHAPQNDVMYFVPSSPFSRATLHFLRAADRELSPAANAFLQTALDLCQNGRILSFFA